MRSACRARFLPRMPSGLSPANEVFPGPDAQSENAVLEFIRNKAESIYHPIGTCKMGVDDQWR